MRLLIMGPPGVGKGTQAKILKEKLGIAHISTGELLRTEIDNDTKIGKIAKRYINQGNLVSDNLILEIVKDRLSMNDCKSGYILDGFPRTLNQAIGLEVIMKDINQNLDIAISLSANESELVERLVKRGLKFGRSDDNSSIIRERQKIYWKLTAPLLEFYEDRNILKSIDGLGTIEEITNRIINIIK
tara:strand:+ start:1560 stop:2120 length:561 start_codon:yes stop_codon:yes gene_type:complete